MAVIEGAVEAAAVLPDLAVEDLVQRFFVFFGVEVVLSDDWLVEPTHLGEDLDELSEEFQVALKFSVLHVVVQEVKESVGVASAHGIEQHTLSIRFLGDQADSERAKLL